mmetsp:Transcript_20070/g.69654  ORF Transcript_20070/g.69654 Transcript_20070/m.69654 type:complete len:236 (+) Transcript_20070:459-1166(+)
MPGQRRRLQTIADAHVQYRRDGRQCVREEQRKHTCSVRVHPGGDALRVERARIAAPHVAGLPVLPGGANPQAHALEPRAIPRQVRATALERAPPREAALAQGLPRLRGDDLGALLVAAAEEKIILRGETILSLGGGRRRHCRRGPQHERSRSCLPRGAGRAQTHGHGRAARRAVSPGAAGRLLGAAGGAATVGAEADVLNHLGGRSNDTRCVAICGSIPTAAEVEARLSGEAVIQ